MTDTNAEKNATAETNAEPNAETSAEPNAERSAAPNAERSAARDHILAQTVFINGANVPFGEFTPDHARARADELRAVTGWGPTAKIGAIAMAWRELSMAMEKASAAHVSDLGDELVVEIAPRLWVVPPGGSLLR